MRPSEIIRNGGPWVAAAYLPRPKSASSIRPRSRIGRSCNDAGMEAFCCIARRA